ncbi:hypothetical protein ACROYT_G024455 [Oculina patagonica]
MLCCNSSPRRRRKLTHKLLTVLLIVLLAVLVCLHLIILPAASGGYNEECYLSDEKHRTLRIMLQNITRVFDKFGVQYWLDYGTLLGAYRTGDILPHDHDADISFILKTESFDAYKELRRLGMKAGGLIAIFGNVTVDFVRWKPVNMTVHGKTEVMLHKYYPPWVKDNFILEYHHTLEAFPQSWVVPPTRINFLGVNVSIPNSPERLLAFRYPYTYGTFGFQFPYKWKCWVPCLLRASNGC